MRKMLKLIRDRRSERGAFVRERPVPSETLARILEAARWAPTAHNMQNFEIVVVDDPAVVERLAAIPTELDATFIRENYAQLSFSEAELRERRVGILGAQFPLAWQTPNPDVAAIAREHGPGALRDTLRDSPTLLVVTTDPRRRAPASENDFLGALSLGCVLQSLWLAAESLDVGFQVMSVFRGGRVEADVRVALAIPEPLRVAFAVRLGFPQRRARYLRVRRELDALVHHNRYGARR